MSKRFIFRRCMLVTNSIFWNNPLIAYVENNKFCCYYLVVLARFGFDLKPIAVAHGQVKFFHNLFVVCQKYELLLLDNCIARPVGWLLSICCRALRICIQ